MKRLGPYPFYPLVVGAWLLLGLACGKGEPVPEPSPNTPPTEGSVSLELVAARDHLEGAFLTPRAVVADRDRIYLASQSHGRLFVMDRKATGFPLVQTLVESQGVGFTSVQTDGVKVFVVNIFGTLHAYLGATPLVAPSVHLVSSLKTAGELALVPGGVVVAQGGSCNVAANGRHIFLSQLNPWEGAKEYALPGLGLTRTYQPTFDRSHVHVMDRTTGMEVASLPAPLDLAGQVSHPAVLADDVLVAVFNPGCCGTGVDIYDARNLQKRMTIPRPWANTVVFKRVLNRTLALIGGEEGGVDVWELAPTSAQKLASLNLRQATGHTGVKDIEIRALWADGHDDLVFAGSSWGNDTSRSPRLPSFFVLRLVVR